MYLTVKKALLVSTMLASISFVGTQNAWAACTTTAGGSLDCDGADDSIDITPNITDTLPGNYNGVSGVSINLDNGEDRLRLTGGSVAGGVQAGYGDDYIVLDGVTLGGNVTLDRGTDALVVTGGSVVDGGIGWYGRGFSADNYFIDNGVIGYLPEGTVSVSQNDSGTVNAGVSIFTGELDDQIAIFGGSVAGEIQGAGGNDTIIIDGGGDEYTGATDELGAAETVYVLPVRPAGFAGGDGATPEAISGAALADTPIVFDGGGGTDKAELFDLVQTQDLIFLQVEEADFYGQAFSLDLDDNRGSGYFLKTDSGGTHSNLIQTDGALTLGGGSLIKAFTANSVTLQDGAVDDSITVSRLVLQGGANLSFDVDASVDGYQADASDYIIANTVDIDDTVVPVTAVNPVNMDVNLVAQGSLSGSRRLIDSGADIGDPGTGATPAPTANYVLVSDPSTAARTYWLQEASNDGVYLLWTTPVNETTTSSVVGGSGTAGSSGPESAALGLGLAAAPMAINDNIAAMARADAGPFFGRSLGEEQDSGTGLQPVGIGERACSSRSGTNAWADADGMTGDIGSSSFESLSARIGGEADLGEALLDQCGELFAGAFAYFGQSNIDTASGSASDTESYGGGAYLRFSNANGFYGSLLGHFGLGNVNATNPVLGSTADYDGLLYGFAANGGLKFIIDEQTVTDFRAYMNYTAFDAGEFTDSMGLVVDGVELETLVYGGDLGIEHYFGSGLSGFARAGLKFTDFTGGLESSGTKVDFATDYLTGTAEAGLSAALSSNSTFTLSAIGEFGDDVTLYGGRVRFQVRF